MFHGYHDGTEVSDELIVPSPLVFAYVLKVWKKLYHRLLASAGLPLMSIDFSFNLGALLFVFLSVIISTVSLSSLLDAISLINSRELKWFS